MKPIVAFNIKRFLSDREQKLYEWSHPTTSSSSVVSRRRKERRTDWIRRVLILKEKTKKEPKRGEIFGKRAAGRPKIQNEPAGTQITIPMNEG